MERRCYRCLPCAGDAPLLPFVLVAEEVAEPVAEPASAPDETLPPFVFVGVESAEPAEDFAPGFPVGALDCVDRVLGAFVFVFELGVLAFVGRLGLEEGATVQGWMNGAIHAHVGTGSLVLGSTVALSAWILRDVVKADTEAGRHAASHGGQS